MGRVRVVVLGFCCVVLCCVRVLLCCVFFEGLARGLARVLLCWGS
jgi:hypothetical protein